MVRSRNIYGKLQSAKLDHIRNEDIMKEVGLHIKPVETFLENKRLKWFGQIAGTKSFWEKEQRSTEKEILHKEMVKNVER